MRDKSFCQGVINEALFEVVIATMQPGLVLSAFFFKLTDSTFYAALPMTLIYLGGLWPPLIVAHIAEGMERKKTDLHLRRRGAHRVIGDHRNCNFAARRRFVYRAGRTLSPALLLLLFGQCGG